jgi:hypothetical protein
MLRRHGRAEEVLATHLTPDERMQLLRLLGKVRQAIEEEEGELGRSSMLFETTGPMPPGAEA